MGMLDGKVAIVTGAGAGLGRAHCHALAAEGATVVVSNRVRDVGAQSSAEVVAQEIAAAGGTAIADTCAVEDWEALGALVERTVSDLGRLDIVVNNAGILVWDAICDIDEATYDELMAINVKGTFALTRHACAYWREAAARGEEIAGRIINTTSGIALFGFPRGGLYGTSKGAVVSLTKVAAMEMRPYGVTANVIWPEARTRMGKGIFPEAPDEPGAFDPYHPENISPLVVYLGSDAAGWVTGQVFYIQGDRVQRIAGWSVDGEYHSESGRHLEPSELANAIPLLHNALPPLQPGTSLQDAMRGIDPERPD
jgi:NAD(P)-dependent dehydrogenase (short-subunit alcohol dehydrogenase family)